MLHTDRSPRTGRIGLFGAEYEDTESHLALKNKSGNMARHLQNSAPDASVLWNLALRCLWLFISQFCANWQGSIELLSKGNLKNSELVTGKGWGSFDILKDWESHKRLESWYWSPSQDLKKELPEYIQPVLSMNCNAWWDYDSAKLNAVGVEI
jgi:hypothetical protein